MKKMEMKNKEISLALVFGLLFMMMALHPIFAGNEKPEGVASVTNVTESELRVAQLEIAPLSNDERKVLFDGLRLERRTNPKKEAQYQVLQRYENNMEWFAPYVYSGIFAALVIIAGVLVYQLKVEKNIDVLAKIQYGLNYSIDKIDQWQHEK